MDVGLLVAGGLTLCLVAGFVLGVVDSVRQLARAVASTGWPVVRGTIVESGWTVVKDRKAEHEVPVVRYRYQIDGRDYESSRIAFWGGIERTGSFMPMTALRWARRWPEGREAEVSHHPKKRELAVLVPGVNWRVVLSLLMSLAGLVVLVGCILLVVLSTV